MHPWPGPWLFPITSSGFTATDSTILELNETTQGFTFSLQKVYIAFHQTLVQSLPGFVSLLSLRLTESYYWDLIDVTLAVEDAETKFVADLDAVTTAKALN